VDKFEPIFDCGEMEHSKEAFGKLVVTGCDRAVGLEMADRVFDTVALPVKAFVPADCGFAVGARWDDRTNATRLKVAANGVAVVSLIRDHGLGRDLGTLDQRFVGCAIRPFAAGGVEGESAFLGVTEAVNLTGEPASGRKPVRRGPSSRRRDDVACPLSPGDSYCANRAPYDSLVIRNNDR